MKNQLNFEILSDEEFQGINVGIGMSALGGAVLGGVTYARPVH